MHGTNPTYRMGLVGLLRIAPSWFLALLNTFLPTWARNEINAIYCLKTGGGTSYASGDDVNLNHGRGAAFKTLVLNNKFGNTNRFTDENGLQVYGSNYVIDHATGLGWCKTLQGVVTWATAVGSYSTFSLTVGPNTFTDFFLPNITEQLTICTPGNGDMLNYAPFNISLISVFGNQIWTSTSRNSTNAATIYQEYQVNNEGKSGTLSYLMCRKHFN